MDGITLTHAEADTLCSHLKFSILNEIRCDECYDNLEYLMNLVHIYERCKAESERNMQADLDCDIHIDLDGDVNTSHFSSDF